MLMTIIMMANDNALENSNRKKIYNLIKNNGGIYFREIMRKLSIKPGALAYHLSVLEKMNLIKSTLNGNNRCFFSIDDKEKFHIVLTIQQKRMITLISQNPGITLNELARILKKNKMVISYHANYLQEVGIINQERRGSAIIYYLK